MALRVLVMLIAMVSAGLSGAAEAQQFALAGHRPHFVRPGAPAKAKAVVEVRNAAVLYRAVSLELVEASVEEALVELVRHAGVRIAYNAEKLPKRKRISLSAASIEVAAALTQILFESGLDVAVARNGQLAVVKCTHLVPAPRAEARDSGTIVGRVTDRATGHPIAGATVVIDETNRYGTTDGDGRFQIEGVEPGTYSVRARYVGYAPLTTPGVVVTSGGETEVEFALVKSVQKLDELVTVTPGGMQTEARALSSPVTVITGEEIEAQRPQTINALFRQLVPSGVGFIPPIQPVATQLSARGTSSISSSSAMKIFIDGVEVAARVSSPVDPSSIERVEVVRGPQATTLYGPDAAGGVLQIFTKRGDGRPRIDLRAQSGVLQTPYEGFGSVLRQEYHGSLTGSDSDVSYTFGGSYTHLDDWVPLGGASTAQSIPSVFGGFRHTSGIVTMDLSSRYQRSVLPLEVNPELQSTGFIFFSRPSFDLLTSENETYSARAAVTPTSWWRNQLTIGIDRSTLDQSQTQPRLTTPADTLFSLSSVRNSKLSLQLNSGVTPRLSADVTGSLIAGVDYYRADQDLESISGALNTTGTIQTTPDAFVSLSNDLITNTGYFAQAQVGWREMLFLNGGVRADANSTYGADLGTPVQPRVGLSAVLQSAKVTLKLRGAYGRAIRAPGIGLAGGAVGAFGTQLANPLLRPERQRGWDAGVDLIFGSRGSLNLTWYDQIAEDLIVAVTTAVSPVFITQYQNVGRVANRGLEVEGALNLHPVQLRAQYAYTDSRIDDLGGVEGTGFTVGGRPGENPAHTAGATLTAAPWRTGNVSLGFTYVGGYRSLDFLALARCFGGTGPCPDPPAISNFQRDYPGFAKATVNITHRITAHLDGLLSIDNLTNSTAFEGTNSLTVMGRTTMVGLHARF